MKHINTYIVEKLKISKPTKVNIKHTLFPNDRYELKDMILDEIAKNGKTCSLNHIDVSHVKTMEYLFLQVDFDGDISHWDVSNVTSMRSMFRFSKFTGKNSNLNNWDVSNVTNMAQMFAS